MSNYSPKEIIKQFLSLLEEQEKSANLKYKLECNSIQNPWFDLHSLFDGIRWVKNSLTGLLLKIENKPIKRSSSRIIYIPSKSYGLFGFFEIFSLLIEGYNIRIYCNVGENVFLDFLCDLLEIMGIHNQLEIKKEFDKKADLLIIDANETTPTFEEYLKKYNHYIIPNKYSVAIVEESWSDEDYKILADYLLTFFGQSPYNIKKLYLENDSVIDNIFSQSEKFNYLKDNHKYYGIYEYELTKDIMASEKVFTNEIFTLKQNNGIPKISQIFFQMIDEVISEKERGKDEDKIELFLKKNQGQIICSFFDFTPFESNRISDLKKAVKNKLS